MPLSRDRPDGFPIHAAGGEPASNITPVREGLFTITGYPEGLIVPSKDHNGKFQSIGFWLPYLDCGTIRNPDWLDVTAEVQLSAGKLEYNVGDSVVAGGGAGVVQRQTLLVRGVRVETDLLTLQTLVNSDRAAEPLLEPAVATPGRIWVYLVVPTATNQPVGIRVDPVAAGTADTPGTDEVTLRGVDVDAGGLVTANVDPTAAPLVQQLPITIPVLFDAATFETLTVLGNTTLGDASGDVLTVNATSSFNAQLTISVVDSTAAIIANTSASTTVLIINQGEGRCMLVQQTATTTQACTTRFENLGDGCATEHLSTSASAAVTIENTGTGRGLVVINDNATSPTLTVTNSDVAGPGLLVTGTATFNDDTSIAASAALRMLSGAQIDMQGASTIEAVATTLIKTGLFEFVAGVAAPTARQITADANNKLVWHDGTGLNQVHFSPNGWVYATGEQIVATALAITQNVATTTDAVTALGSGNVRVIVHGQAQVNALGSTLTINVEEDQTANPAFISISTSQVVTATHTQADANAWQSFRHERVFNAGTAIATFYQCQVMANGGQTVSVKEVYLRVVNERA